MGDGKDLKYAGELYCSLLRAAATKGPVPFTGLQEKAGVLNFEDFIRPLEFL